MRWLFAVVSAALIGIAVMTSSSANAQPVPPQPPPPPPVPVQPGSTTEELAEMVLDAIEHDSPLTPTTPPLPVPQP
jgi:hypothetical protein